MADFCLGMVCGATLLVALVAAGEFVWNRLEG